MHHIHKRNEHSNVGLCSLSTVKGDHRVPHDTRMVGHNKVLQGNGNNKLRHKDNNSGRTHGSILV